MPDPVKFAKQEGLMESVIALSRQIVELQTMVDQGVRRYSGSTPLAVLYLTAKALLWDVKELEDLRGADEWSDAKRQQALAVLRKE